MSYKLKVESYKFWLALALVATCNLQPATAELTATVSPGIQFAPGDRPTVSQLNRLGLPTITITGTLDGTNAGISAGSLNANMFSASVVDNDTLDFTNSSPQALRIKAAGVDIREISSNIAGPGLTGGSGVALTNNVDGVTLVITNDVVTLATNVNPWHLLVASNSVVVGTTNSHGLAMTPLQFATNVFPQFTFSTTVALSGVSSAGIAINAAHSLGTTPAVVIPRLICTTAEHGYAIGDRVYEWTASANGVAFEVPGAAGANSTNAFYTVLLGAPSWYVLNKSTAAISLLTPASWSLELIARP